MRKPCIPQACVTTIFRKLSSNRRSSATHGMKVSCHWWYKEMRHHWWQIWKWNAKGSQKSLKYRRDIKLFCLAMLCFLLSFKTKGWNRSIRHWDIAAVIAYPVVRKEATKKISLYVLKQEENSFWSGSLSQAFGQLWSSIKMMARRRRGNQGEVYY